MSSSAFSFQKKMTPTNTSGAPARFSFGSGQNIAAGVAAECATDAPAKGKAALSSSSSGARPAPASHAQVGAQPQPSQQVGATVLPEGILIDPLSSPDAEFELCGWLLRMDAEQMPLAERLFDRLSHKDISHPVFANIIKATGHLVAHNQVCGATAVLNYAAINRLDVGGPDHLAQLVNDPIGQAADEERLQQDIDIIHDYSVRRKIRGILNQSLNDLSSKPVPEIIAALIDASSSLQNDSKVVRSEPKHISEVMDAVITNMFDERPDSAPIATGFYDLDKATNGGVRDQDLVIIGGRPGMGKTALAINGIGRNAALDTRHNRPVLIFSLEMSAESLGNRMLASEAGIPAKLFRLGNADNPQFQFALEEVLPRFAPLTEGNERITPETMATASSARLWIDDTPGLTLTDVRVRSRQFSRQFGRPLIIIDYLQLLAGAGADQRAVGEVSTALKALARELNTPIIALAQLNRSLESRTNKQPIMSDLRESGNIEQDADIIAFLYRDVIYNPDTQDPDEALVIIAKQREGEIGPVPLRFNSTLVRFENWHSEEWYGEQDRVRAGENGSGSTRSSVRTEAAEGHATPGHPAAQNDDGEDEDWLAEPFYQGPGPI